MRTVRMVRAVASSIVQFVSLPFACTSGHGSRSQRLQGRLGMVRQVGVATIVGAVALALTVSGCSASPGPAAPVVSPSADRSTESSSDRDPTLDYRDATAVCGAFSRTAYTVDATVDRHPDDAFLRSRPYVSERFYADVVEGPRGRVGVRWQALVAHRATVTVELQPFIGDNPGFRPDPRAASVFAVTTAVGRDGWQGPVERYAVHCTLVTDVDGDLRVDAYTFDVLS